MEFMEYITENALILIPLKGNSLTSIQQQLNAA